MKNVGCLFILGTASHSGKSVVTAGLCRHFRRLGLRVAPFKSQNMALNSAATPEGKEMGRAQAVQAEACGIAPEADMNPILLKPCGPNRMQVVLQGRVHGDMSAQEYYRRKSFFLEKALESYDRLSRRFDLILAEGAGSPVEVNLLDRDIVNLPLARRIDASCLLVADIDRGGVFASLVGTRELCSPEDRQRIRAFLINKFRGQRELFQDGVGFLERKTDWPCLGVVPFFDWLALEEEDSVALEDRVRRDREVEPGSLRVAVLRIPHMANYNDFAPLESSKGVDLRFAVDPKELLGADLIVIPGSKNTLDDLLWLRRNRFDRAIEKAIEDRTFLLGICGGYQMLGLRVDDPHGLESDSGSMPGLGMLEMTTEMAAQKATVLVEAIEVSSGLPVRGYEIHLGRSRFEGPHAPLFRLKRRGPEQVDWPEGAVSGNVWGTYLHGIFENREFTQGFFRRLAQARGKPFAFEWFYPKEEIYDRWADALERELNVELLHRIAGLPQD